MLCVQKLIEMNEPERIHLSMEEKTYPSPKNWTLALMCHWPDRLNPDWCRLRTGWLGCLAGEVLAEEAGVMVLGVTDTSQTGPSYSPLGTPLSSASCILENKIPELSQRKLTRKYSMHPSIPRRTPAHLRPVPNKLHHPSSLPLNNHNLYKKKKKLLSVQSNIYARRPFNNGNSDPA